jgi:hypothetical protein
VKQTSAAAPPPVARRGPPQPEPEPEPEEEEGPQGEWAEVLYDYVSDVCPLVPFATFDENMSVSRNRET